MWKVLLPLGLLLVVVLLQLKRTEGFYGGRASYSGSKSHDASGNNMDASGNCVDASGNPTDASGCPVKKSSTSNTITLTIADLLALFSASSSSATTTTTTPAATPAATATAPSGTDFYNKIRPSLIKDIKNAVDDELDEQDGGDSGCNGGSSPSMMQGAELNNALKNIQYSQEFIRKDSIPCYGCSLPS